MRPNAARDGRPRSSALAAHGEHAAPAPARRPPPSGGRAGRRAERVPRPARRRRPARRARRASGRRAPPARSSRRRSQPARLAQKIAGCGVAGASSTRSKGSPPSPRAPARAARGAARRPSRASRRLAALAGEQQGGGRCWSTSGIPRPSTASRTSDHAAPRDYPPTGEGPPHHPGGDREALADQAEPRGAGGRPRRGCARRACGRARWCAP